MSVNNDLQAFYDSISMLLPDGTVLVAPVDPANYNGTLIYNPFSNTWTNGPLTGCQPPGHRLPGGGLPGSNWRTTAFLPLIPPPIILVGTNTERYIPSLGQWIVRHQRADSPYMIRTPLALGEMGAALLLARPATPLYFGASGHTAYYAPGGGTSKGSWTRRAGHSRRPRRLRTPRRP